MMSITRAAIEKEIIFKMVFRVIVKRASKMSFLKGIDDILGEILGEVK